VCSKPIALALKGFNGGAARSIRDSASEMFCNVIQWTEHAVADIYVNATPIDIEFEPPPNKDALVYDLNYGESKFLESAKKAGFKTKNGKEMLVWNSILSFRKFIGKEPSAISRAHVLDKYCGVVK
jgi:shikimate 5-dehydrogenase